MWWLKTGHGDQPGIAGLQLNVNAQNLELLVLFLVIRGPIMAFRVGVVPSAVLEIVIGNLREEGGGVFAGAQSECMNCNVRKHTYVPEE